MPARAVTAVSPLLGLVAALALPLSSARAEPGPAFGPGEQISYDISYLGITGAQAQITVGAESTYEGTPVWPIVGLANTDSKLAFYPVRDRFVTYWDYDNNRSIGHDFVANENKRRRRQRVRLDHDARSARVLRQHEDSKPEEKTFDITPGSGDVAATAYQLRNLPLGVGKSFELPVFTGQKSFMLKAKVEGVERLKTDLGEKEVYRIRIQTDFSGRFASKRDLFTFVTTDDAHVPVRIEADFLLGSMRAEITDYKPGRRMTRPLREAASDGGASRDAAKAMPGPQSAGL